MVKLTRSWTVTPNRVPVMFALPRPILLPAGHALFDACAAEHSTFTDLALVPKPGCTLNSALVGSPLPPLRLLAVTVKVEFFLTCDGDSEMEMVPLFAAAAVP